MKFAIVGSGPSAFYTAKKLLNHGSVTIFEKRLVPFGLVRYGVAPDHPDVKNCTNKFDEILSHPNVNFVGNCNVGVDLPISKLSDCFNAVVIATGSSGDRKLGIENENVSGIYSAREFVGWYNGDTEVKINPNLICTDAMIIGNGNVALDCARMLLTDSCTLSRTDISQRALDALRMSTVQNVHVVGRRGVLQASFTTKELREILQLPVNFYLDEKALVEINDSKEDWSNNRSKKRLVDVLLRKPTILNGRKGLYLDVYKSPSRILKVNNSIAGVEFNRNTKKNGKETIKCGLLIKSIGYLNLSMPGVPFDRVRNLIPNLRGKVIDNEAKVAADNIFVAGWIKTGPVGVLTSTLFDANETAATVEENLAKLKADKPGLNGLDCLNFTTSLEDWKRIDTEEIRRGQLVSKPREKITCKNEMLKLIKYRTKL